MSQMDGKASVGLPLSGTLMEIPMTRYAIRSWRSQGWGKEGGEGKTAMVIINLDQGRYVILLESSGVESSIFTWTLRLGINSLIIEAPGE